MRGYRTARIHPGVLDRQLEALALAAALVAGRPDVAGDASGGFAWAPMGPAKHGILDGALLADRFRGRYIRDPQVTVNLKQIVSQTVTVSGEVKRAGVYPIVGKMTLVKAIASAEGWTDFSQKGEVVVLRTVGGQDYAALYDMRAIERGRYQDPEIYANDTIVVGKSESRRIFRDILTASPLIAPVFLLLRNN